DGSLATTGRLDLKDTTVSNNIAKGGANGGTAAGGGVSSNYGAPITMTRGTVSENSAYGVPDPSGNGAAFGGGIASYAPITIVGTFLLGNTAQGVEGLGGGLYLGTRNASVPGSFATATNATFSGNQALGGLALGGGAMSDGGPMTFNNSTFNNNT